MRLARRHAGAILEGDMTPMIDMSFQLIAFFTVMMNFTQTEVNARIQLPESELAKPPDAPMEFPITLQLTREGTVIVGGEEMFIEGLRPYLVREADVLALQGRSKDDATVVIRAHKDAKTGDVQKLIQVCQQNSFEKFALRAQEKTDY